MKHILYEKYKSLESVNLNPMETKYKEQLGLSIINETLNEN